MTTLIIIRHGFSKNNKEKRFTGQFDAPLDEIGVMQAEITGKYISENYKVDAIYSSDLSRAVNTAKPLADILSLPIITSPKLREINVGSWQNILVSDVIERDPEAYKWHKENPELTRFGDGESYAELTERAVDIIDEIARENDGKTVAVATHGGLVRALLCHMKNMPISQINAPENSVCNASITIINYDNGRAELVTAGSTEHLSEITK